MTHSNRKMSMVVLGLALQALATACGSSAAKSGAGQVADAAANDSLGLVDATDGDEVTDVTGANEVDPAAGDGQTEVSNDASIDSGADALSGEDTELTGDVAPEVVGDTSEPADTQPADTQPACQSAADCKPTSCQDALCISGVCQYGAKADGAPCPTLDLCAGGGQCQAGTCQPNGQKPCDDNNLCTADACDPKTGACVHEVKTAAPCDDGNPCTKGDACAFDGKCVGGSNVCSGCTSLKDCAAYDDGNPCNGSLYCNTAKLLGVCEILPTSVVVCDSSADGPCGQTACDPKNGLCALTAKADGTVCDDGNPCTQGDFCASGKCTPKADVCQCQSDGDCAAWDDDSACNGKLFCDTSGFPHACKVNPATVVTCTGVPEPCQALACNPASGKCNSQPLPDGAACSDGILGTIGDSCQAGKCVGGVDTSLCKTDLDCLAQEDGDLCNGTLFCNKATGKCELNPKTAVSCPSAADTVCEKNLCQKNTGLCQKVPVSEGQGCDDGNVCTQGEVCQKGTCVASADTCACKADADCKSQEDGDLCNGTLYCDKQVGKCVVNPATVVGCSTTFDNTCTKNLCDKKTGKCGMTAVAEGKKCDDGNNCTVGEVCTAGSCTASADTCVCKSDSDCKPFEDGNLCNGTLYCNKTNGQCVVNPATIVVCKTALDTECLHTQCNAVSGACEATAVNEGGQCDADGNPCTKNDWCSGGTCKPGAMTCNCQLDSDCAGTQGDDKCVGGMYCELTVHECKPAKLVQCDSTQDGPCQVTACDKATGQCQQKPRADGTVCEENTLCTGAQICEAGSCVTGKAVNCDDVNPCTADSCDAKQGGCLHAPLDATPCDDNSACTTDDVCAKGSCVGNTLPCNDNEACSDDSCDPKTGCVHLAVAATACDDQDPCTVGDTCGGGKCLAGKDKLGCDDGNPCTADTCQAGVGCGHDAAAQNGQTCDDAEVCTVGDACSGGACLGLAKDCNDNNACTVESCEKGKGCMYLPLDATPCSDGNACTVEDSCAAGKCAAGPALDCNDAEPCSDDSCIKSSGCVHVAKGDATKCSDSNPCTTKDACQTGKCVGAAVNCDDDNVCTDDSCDIDLGKCVNLPGTVTNCDDGNICTVGDACKAGSCKAGLAKPCDDANPCTSDSCEPAQDCVHLALSGQACNDGSLCTDADQCSSGKCTGKSKVCDDGKFCTADDCDPATGCTGLSKEGTPCNDNDACTKDDTCSQSTCTGAVASCDDGNSCTTDTCDSASGCKKVILDAVACNDGSSCTVADLCKSGTCVGAPTRWVKDLSWPEGGNDEFHKVLWLPGGKLAAFGYRRWQEQAGIGFLPQPRIVVLDEIGGVVVDTSVTPVNQLVGNAWLAATLNSTGEMIAFNRSQDGITKDFDVGVSRLSADGKVVGFESWSYTGNQTLTAATATTDKFIVAVGNDAGGAKGFMVRVNDNGTKGVAGASLWAYNTGTLLPGGLRDVTAIASGQVAAMGFNGTTNYLTRITTSGGLSGITLIATVAGNPLELVRLVAHPAGGYLAAGSIKVNGVTRPALLRLSASFTITWSAIAMDLKGLAITAARVAGGPGTILVGTNAAAGSGSDTGFMASVDDNGNVMWTRTFPAGPAATFQFGEPGPDGRLAWAHTVNVSGAADSRIVVSDLFGALSCGESGSCSAKLVPGCDDSNPCTADTCSAAKGCEHSNLTDGAVCATGKTCANGECK